MTKAVHSAVEMAILRLLSDAGHLVDDVRVEGRSSGGAMRDTYFVFATGPGGSTQAVAQVRPSDVMRDQLLRVEDEVIVRVLRELRDDGLVETGTDGIALLDPVRLSSEAYPAGTDVPSG